MMILDNKWKKCKFTKFVAMRKKCHIEWDLGFTVHRGDKEYTAGICDKIGQWFERSYHVLSMLWFVKVI